MTRQPEQLPFRTFRHRNVAMTPPPEARRQECCGVLATLCRSAEAEGAALDVRLQPSQRSVQEELLLGTVSGRG